jgi:hypothetical protein
VITTSAGWPSWQDVSGGGKKRACPRIASRDSEKECRKEQTRAQLR